MGLNSFCALVVSYLVLHPVSSDIFSINFCEKTGSTEKCKIMRFRILIVTFKGSEVVITAPKETCSTFCPFLLLEYLVTNFYQVEISNIASSKRDASVRIPKETVQRRSQENNRNSTTCSHF